MACLAMMNRGQLFIRKTSGQVFSLSIACNHRAEMVFAIEGLQFGFQVKSWNNVSKHTTQVAGGCDARKRVDAPARS